MYEILNTSEVSMAKWELRNKIKICVAQQPILVSGGWYYWECNNCAAEVVG
ncbi:hypothetical protein C5167_006568 [Papaver somniferum]|uniref:Uncharacterized protein n=1 Tax=Papaver somniferum TaxID=3469 RepID=A0A4Y7JHY2_PAPSO|nr:hypothetical protein C5167_006568 [Papaver somniferum]